mmetsp:Transcript_8763/g.15240  ORF Transcript_8763/g.15240 Transcript_8763/m.15240 type:complete len:113 (+) Transcript_8763:230-568(+)
MSIYAEIAFSSPISFSSFVLSSSSATAASLPSFSTSSVVTTTLAVSMPSSSSSSFAALRSRRGGQDHLFGQIVRHGDAGQIPYDAPTGRVAHGAGEADLGRGVVDGGEVLPF